MQLPELASRNNQTIPEFLTEKVYALILLKNFWFSEFSNFHHDFHEKLIFDVLMLHAVTWVTLVEWPLSSRINRKYDFNGEGLYFISFETLDFKNFPIPTTTSMHEKYLMFS